MGNLKKFGGSIVAALCVGSFLMAQEVNSEFQPEIELGEEDIIIVTAAKVQQSSSQAVEKVSVISQQMIEEAGAHNLSEVLNMIPGVTYSGTAVGSGEPLQMNGFSDEYVKVLVDGVPVNTGGSPNALQMLSLDNVDHIEVMNGSASALYGSDAIAGVINIITKKGASDQPFSFYVEQDGHTNMNFKNLSGKGLNGGAGMSFYGQQLRVQLDGSYGVTPGTWEDKDGYVNEEGKKQHDLAYKEYGVPRSYKYALNGLVGWSFDADRDVFAKFNWTSNDTQFFKSSDQIDAYSGTLAQSLMGSVNLDWAFDDRQSLTGFVSQRWNRSTGNRVSFATEEKTSLTPSWYNDVEMEAMYLNDLTANQQLMVGLNNLYTIYNNGTDQYSSLQFALFAQDIIDFGPVQLIPGTRFTLLAPVKGIDGSKEDVKWNISPKLSLKWDILSNLALRMGVGSGYRLPTSSQKYSTSTKGYGNPHLKPETSWSGSLGLEWLPLSALSLSADSTAAYLKDMIVRTQNPDWKVQGKPTSNIMRFYENVNEAVSVNTSIHAKLLLGDWRASLTYTNLFIRQTEEGQWIEINGKSPHQVMASLAYTIPGIKTNLSLNGTWHAPKPGGKNNILDGTYSSDYLMINFRGEQPLLDDALVVYGGIKNMLNNISFVKGTNGETMADGYESDEGLVLYLGARYQF